MIIEFCTALIEIKDLKASIVLRDRSTLILCMCFRGGAGGHLGLAGAFTSSETLELCDGVFKILMYMKLLLIFVHCVGCVK